MNKAISRFITTSMCERQLRYFNWLIYQMRSCDSQHFYMCALRARECDVMQRLGLRCYSDALFNLLSLQFAEDNESLFHQPASISSVLKRFGETKFCLLLLRIVHDYKQYIFVKCIAKSVSQKSGESRKSSFRFNAFRIEPRIVIKDTFSFYMTTLNHE